MAKWTSIPGTGTYTTFDGHVVMLLEGEHLVEVEDRLLAELIEAARKLVKLTKMKRRWSLEKFDERVEELEKALVALSAKVGSQVEAEAQSGSVGEPTRLLQARRTNPYKSYGLFN